MRFNLDAKRNTMNMRCCVPFCQNTSSNTASDRTGISFHYVPIDKNLRAAWLRSLGTQDHQLPDPAVVCSQHFLDDDFYNTQSCVRQIHSNSIPSTVKVCMICLDTDSKQVLMSKHKLEEPYQQLTGLSLRHRGNLKQSLCVLCAQRLINFNRFRDLCLSSYSLMTDLLEQQEFITIQHKELMNNTTKHPQCKLTLTTLGADHCDLYIDHTEEEEQIAAVESVVGDVATVVVKTEDSSDLSNIGYLELAQKDDIDRSNIDGVSSIMNIKLELPVVEGLSDPLQWKAATSEAAHNVAETEVHIKCESITFECTYCFEEFVTDNAFQEHMCVYLQRAACEASQVCEPAAVGCSWDALLLDNKTGCQGLNNGPPLAADCAQAIVAPLSTGLEANKKNKVQATKQAGVIQKRKRILKTNLSKVDKQSSCIKKAVQDENPQARSRSGAKSHSCEICNYSCIKKSDLTRHIRTHTGEKPYSCEMCNFKCAHKSMLSVHKRTHTGEKPFSCEMCSFKSAHKGSLLQHKKSHTGEKPFSCETCDYKCIKKSDLSKHKRTHTGEKPYSCGICNYRCAQKSMLLMHNRTHSGEKPYSCETCNYKCIQKSDLSKHKKTHTGEKPYSCDLCHYKTGDRGSLVRHIRMHQRNQ